MRTARRSRLAVVGLGRIGRLHADNLSNRVGSAQLAAVVDANEELARRFGEVHGVTWTARLEDILGDPSLDGVVISAPSGLHPELVKLAAGAGKHVFCEKPLGLDSGACRAAVSEARAAGVALQVGFQRRFDPDWQAMKAALDEGATGALQLFRSSHRNAHAPSSVAELGDVFVDIAIHDLDAARWLGGRISELYASTTPDGTGCAVIAARFESGALAAIDVHRAAGYGFECSAEVVGSKGTVRCGYSTRGGCELLADGRASTVLAENHAARHAAAYVAELEHFGNIAAGRGDPRVGGEDAAAALELAELACRAAARGTPLPVPQHVAAAL
jgi:myo-inositol 2-dehydrogenase/D-chiro-inositol 1-dehydrogenase